MSEGFFMPRCHSARLAVLALVALWISSRPLHADSKSTLHPPDGGRARGEARLDDDEIRLKASQLARRLSVAIVIDDAAGDGVPVLRTESGAGGQLDVRWRERDGLPLGASAIEEFTGRGVRIVAAETGAVLLDGRFPLGHDHGDDDDVDDDGDDGDDDDGDDDDGDDDDGDEDDDDEGDADGDDRQKLVVEFPLFSTGAERGIRGNARFESQSSDDDLDAETEIEIEDGTPGARYLVQITRPRPFDLIPFRATLSPEQVVPSPEVPSMAGGVGRFSFAPAARELSYLIELSGLSSPEVGARIHVGRPGEVGPAIATLEPGRLKEGTVVLGRDAAAHLLAGSLYVNVQTGDNPQGEVRGQILPVEPETERIAVVGANSFGDAAYEADGLPFGAMSVLELVGARVDVFRLDGDRQVRVLTGVVPDIGDAEVPSGHRIRVEPRALLFGEVLVGEARSLRLTVTNTGRKKLNVVRIELEDGTTPEFSIHGFEHVHLAPGASLTARVSYAPLDTGFDHGALVVRSNAQFANKVSVPLAGSGIGSREPNIDVEPRRLEFGRVPVGGSRVLETTITNLGASDLVVRAIELAAGTSPEFEFDALSPGASLAPVSLAPGASVGVPVRFRPADAGESTGGLLISSTDVDEPAVRVALSGVGVAAPTPAIAVDPPALSFEDVLVGTARVLAATVRNVGTADLQITGVELGAASSADFTVITEPTDFVLAPGASAPVEVRYLPSAAAFDSGTVEVASNDADEPLVAISLSGRGVTLEAPEIDVSPGALRFGEVFVGSSGTLEATVANTGSANLEVTGVGLGSGSSSAFALARDIESVSVAPGAVFVIPVRFLPTTEGPAAGTLVISSDDADEPTVTIALSGAGIVLEVPDILVTPASLGFGARSIGSTSVRTVGIRNTGSSTLEILSIALRPSSSSAFSLVGEPGAVSLVAGASIQVQVRFRPTRQGSASGALVIESDDPRAPEVVVSLTGIGLPDPVARLEVTPLRLDFGAVSIQGTKAQTITICNTGTAPLELAAIALGAGTSSSFDLPAGASGASLAPGAETAVQVTYSPAAAGADSGTLRVYEPLEGDVPVATVSLFGAAINPSGVPFRRGDVDANHRVNLIDALVMADFLFGGRAEPTCLKASDSNDDGVVNISDLLYLLNHLFTGAPPPAHPHGECGTDPSPDQLACEGYSGCS